MLDAMVRAEVGDDVYQDDPTTLTLQDLAAKMVGKESALFVPSGTFGNQLALISHTERGDEILIPESNHIVMHEVGASAVIAGVQLRCIPDVKGRITINDLQQRYRDGDIHNPRTALICLENAHSSGKVIPLVDMKEIFNYSKSLGVPIHLDGARIFNAALALKVDATEISQYCDSVMFCLSKGLCAPIGSILAGSKSFINRALKNRKLMGGGLRQSGYLAAAGIISLKKMVHRLSVDHENAQYLAQRLSEIPGFEIFNDRLDINMVFFRIQKRNFDSNTFVQFLYKKNIKINPPSANEYRLVTHYWIDKRKIDRVIMIMKEYLQNVI
ncbi:MAG: low specificity L-threonine aldolase [Candidatus Atribacteria bacterium]|nr:low specificity L-threonine aldolase [Candidatus Atribacteria bacterium]